MSIQYCGKLVSSDQLQNENLPITASEVISKKHDTRARHLDDIYFFTLVLFYVLLSLYLLNKKFDSIDILTALSVVLLGLVLFPLQIIAHEFLHAIFFPKNSKVQIFYMTHPLTLIVFSGHAISRFRFIIMSLFPSIVFTWLLLVIAVFVSYTFLAGTLILLGFASLLSSREDYSNVFSILSKTPKKCKLQMNGGKLYWISE
jgi:hypothetical protein